MKYFNFRINKTHSREKTPQYVANLKCLKAVLQDDSKAIKQTLKGVEYTTITYF